jgi:hypothetical protein
MFGAPTIYITSPEACRRILMDDEHFVTGWPKATMELMGRKSFIGKLVLFKPVTYFGPIFGSVSICVHVTSLRLMGASVTPVRYISLDFSYSDQLGWYYRFNSITYVLSKDNCTPWQNKGGNFLELLMM